MEVTVYTTPSCPYCRMVKQFLSQKGVPFREIDISSNRAAAQELLARSGQLGVPVTFVDGTSVIGYDRDRLDQLISLGQREQRPSLGVIVADAGKITARHGLPVTPGAYVGRVRPGSAGERLGLAAGDIITELNMRPIVGAESLENAVSGLTRGSRISLVFVRSGQTRRAEGIL